MANYMGTCHIGSFLRFNSDESDKNGAVRFKIPLIISVLIIIS